MKIVIIEDEPLAQQRLQKILQDIDSQAEVVALIDSIETGLTWFEGHKDYDLVLADIQLGDGLSLDLLKSAEVSKPVIFVTAFDHYALSAFEHLSVAYLLKPIQADALAQALQKAKNFNQPLDVRQLLQLLRPEQGSSYQQRLLIRYGSNLKAVPFDEIACFYVEERVVMVATIDKRHLAADQNLEQLEKMVDPAKFFRINRKVLVNIKAIKNMQTYSRSRVMLQLEPEVNTDLIVSTERASAFKKWLEG
jgi:DNA-binding LytR/AlgR family response regulator